MCCVIFFVVVVILLVGCVGMVDLFGIWINQVVIDVVSKDGKLCEVLFVYGLNLEWKFDSKVGEVIFSNGFELGEGILSKSDDEYWKVVFYGDDNQESFELDGKELIQQVSVNGLEQCFCCFDL